MKALIKKVVTCLSTITMVMLPVCAKENAALDIKQQIARSSDPISLEIQKLEPVESNAEILELFEEQDQYINEIIQLKNQKQLQKNSSDIDARIAELEQQYEAINKKLEQKNTPEVSGDTLQKIMEIIAPACNNLVKSGYPGPPTEPVDSEDVRWTNNWHSQTWKGRSYYIYRLYARPTTTTGRMHTSIYKSDYLPQDIKSQLFDVYANKVIGAVAGLSKVASWLPYELLFNVSSTNYTGQNYYLSAQAASTICYTFIWESNYNLWNFVTTTNYAAISLQHTLLMLKPDGSPTSDQYKKDFSTSTYGFLEESYSLDRHHNNYQNKPAASPQLISLGDMELRYCGHTAVLPIKFYPTPSYLY